MEMVKPPEGAKKRKVIQIAIGQTTLKSVQGVQVAPVLHVLCDDGTVWYRIGETWHLISDVPQE